MEFERGAAMDLCTPNSGQTQTRKLHKSTRTSYKQSKCMQRLVSELDSG
jgi:hypothetical protein